MITEVVHGIYMNDLKGWPLTTTEIVGLKQSPSPEEHDWHMPDVRFIGPYAKTQYLAMDMLFTGGIRPPNGYGARGVFPAIPYGWKSLDPLVLLRSISYTVYGMTTIDDANGAFNTMYQEVGGSPKLIFDIPLCDLTTFEDIVAQAAADHDVLITVTQQKSASPLVLSGIYLSSYEYPEKIGEIPILSAAFPCFDMGGELVVVLRPQRLICTNSIEDPYFSTVQEILDWRP